MVAFTPNRGYPYAQPTDPADVPERLQAFAEAVDVDLSNLESLAEPRNMAQFFGNVPNTIAGTAVAGLLTWQLTDFNTAPNNPPFLPGNPPSVVPVTDATTTQLVVNYPGLWYVSASVQLGTSGTGIDMAGLEILQNNFLTVRNPQTLTHDTIFATDITHTLDVSGCLFMAAGDSVAIRAHAGRSSGAASVRFFNRSITLLRMTLS